MGRVLELLFLRTGLFPPFPFSPPQKDAQFGEWVVDHECGVSSRVMLKKGDGVLVAVFKDQ